jgi:hypothetical protein
MYLKHTVHEKRGFLSLSEDVGGLVTLMGELGAQEEGSFIRGGSGTKGL